MNQVNKYQKNWERINEATKQFQMQIHYLSSYQEDLELIIADIEGNVKMLIMNFMVISLGKSIFHHHRQNSKIHIFKSGFLKIQNNDLSDITVE